MIEHPAASYVMRVVGESMTGAGINDGNFIVVSRSVAPNPGYIVVALIRDKIDAHGLEVLSSKYTLYACGRSCALHTHIPRHA